MYKICLILAPFILCSCTTDPLPEEGFEGPTSDFPLLGTVPDRPPLPKSTTLRREENRLRTEHKEATQKYEDFVNSHKNK